MRSLSRRLSLSGWNYYEFKGLYYQAISKSEYYKYKQDNIKEKAEEKILKNKLRNS